MLADPVLHPQSDQVPTQYHVLDLLAFCITAHSYRMKQFVMQSNMISKVLQLLQAETRPPNHLACGMLPVHPPAPSP